MSNIFIAIIIITFSLVTTLSEAKDSTSFSHTDLATLLMNSTFKIEGDSVNGTSFLIGKHVPHSPDEAYYVLVTAAHVIESIPGNSATERRRKREGSSESQAD